MTATAEAEVLGPRRTLTALRVVTVLHSVSAVAQPVLAGEYLAGDIDALALHSLNSSITTGLGVIQLVAAIVYVWAGHGRFWPLIASFAIALVEEVQAGVGYEGNLAVHVPLGVSLIATQILLTGWLFRDSAGRRRSR